MNTRFISTVMLTLGIAGPIYSTEPNQTFATATVLSSDVSNAFDELTIPGLGHPDTVLGVRDESGTFFDTNDDDSRLGDGRGSELTTVPTNSGSIDFVVSGYPDFDFTGDHVEQGQYEVFVDVYDSFGDPIESFSDFRTLEPGIVHDFFYSNLDWIDGDYDVYINNAIDPSDLDFFTFTGLTPGAAFTAQTLDPEGSGIDTYLGWFDSDGTLLEAHDDIDFDNGNYLSLLEVIVPANKMLTFAVTGYGDDGFVGNHGQFGTYGLELTMAVADLPGDFNGDGRIDAGDYVRWRNHLGEADETNINGAGDGGGVTPSDYTWWKQHYGTPGSGTGGLAQSAPPGAPGPGAKLNAVPEPGSLAMAVLAVFGLFFRGRRANLPAAGRVLIPA